jgi:protein phosphatase
VTDPTSARNPIAAAFGRLLGRRGAGPAAAAPLTVELPTMTPGTVLPETRVAIGLASDVGCVRTVNEDAVRVVRDLDSPTPAGVLAVVCDGMGGHAAGEVASALACDVIAREWTADPDPAVALARAVQRANHAIMSAAARDSARGGMGTTCVALVLRGGMAWCAHVGDSRCYLVRDGQLFLMTEDHSAVMELVRRGEITADAARSHPDKNVISQALGGRGEVEVSVWPRPFRLRVGDRFLLCSDGLYDVVDDASLRAVVAGSAPQEACDALVALARANGAPDNVSAVVLAIPAEDAREVAREAVRETRVSDLPAAGRLT